MELNIMTTRIFKILMCHGFPLLAWCGGENFVAVADTKGLEPDAPVIWSDGKEKEYVGKVSHVIANDDGNSTIYFNFRQGKDFEDIIREDVRACPILDTRITQTPVLFLVGGTNTTLSCIGRGTEIFEIPLLPSPPSVNLLKWLLTNKFGITILLIVLVVGLLVCTFVKTVFKLAKYLLIASGIVIVLYYGNKLVSDWKNYKINISEYVGNINHDKIQNWLINEYQNINHKIPDFFKTPPKSPTP